MSDQASLPKVVILGGGMAGLATAWELSRGDWRQRYASITLYQRGWRLGGKGASSRGANGRIEEHGLHVLLGYYRETFRMMDECYQELDRARRRPHCPLATWHDAIFPSTVVGLTEQIDGAWKPWSMDFPTRPASWAAGRSRMPFDAIGVVLHSLRLLAAFHASWRSDTFPVTVTSRPEPLVGDSMTMLRGAGLTILAGAVQLAERATDATGIVGGQLAGPLRAGLATIRERIYEPMRADLAESTTWTLVDMVMTNLIGVVADRLLTRPEGLAAIDDLDFREWLDRHGASAATQDNAIIRGMYDLVFAYRNGDRSQPAFAAGLGLELATRMLLDYEGSLFWKMRAGMGEVIFAPLFEALEDRGVEFRFFHRVDQLTVADGAVTSIEIGRQADCEDGPGGYRPLIDVGGLPAWPAVPDFDQLRGDGAHLRHSESFFGERRDAGAVELAAGRDFDVVVFALSLGIVPEVAGQLVASDPRWRAMVDNVATVATQSFQIWMREPSAALGWAGGDDVTLSGFAEPFDTWAAMSHLLATEGWDNGEAASLHYFCGVMPDGAGATADGVRDRAIEFLDSTIGELWPAARTARGFNWQGLVASDDLEGRDRFRAQYWRANRDPSDRYVQSLPGTDRYRLAPGDTGFANLVIAGDWTDCGLNAGCIEAAVRSGVLAATAVAERV